MEPTNTPEPVEKNVEQTPMPANSTPKMSIPAAILTGAAMIALVLIVVLRPSATAQQAAGTPQPAQQPAQPTVAPNISKIATTNEPFIGNINAPITIAYWFDYQCPFCQRNEENVMPQLITNYVNTGKVKIVFKDFPFLGPDSQTLAVYGRAVFAVDPAKFYDWHKAIFDNQGEEGSGWATTAKITSITQGVLGAAETTKVTQMVATNGATYAQEIAADKTEAGTIGVDATPAALIGTDLIVGAEPYTTFQQAIQAVSAK